MLIYLDNALKERRARATREGRVARERPARGHHGRRGGAGPPEDDDGVAITAGLMPILWSTGTGSEVMQRIAVPMIGGMVSSTILTLVVIPAVYALIKQAGLRRHSLGGQVGACYAAKENAEVSR